MIFTELNPNDCGCMKSYIGHVTYINNGIIIPAVNADVTVEYRRTTSLSVVYDKVYFVYLNVVEILVEFNSLLITNDEYRYNTEFYIPCLNFSEILELDQSSGGCCGGLLLGSERLHFLYDIKCQKKFVLALPFSRTAPFNVFDSQSWILPQPDYFRVSNEEEKKDFFNFMSNQGKYSEIVFEIIEKYLS